MPETRLTIPIRGMHCAACVKTIEEVCRETPGVAEATVNFATGGDLVLRGLLADRGRCVHCRRHREGERAAVKLNHDSLF